MSEYNFDNLNNPATVESNYNEQYEADKKPQYIKAFFAGLGTSILVGIILAVIGIWAESEYILALIVGAIIVVSVIRSFVPEHSVGGAVIGAILTPTAYLIYQFIMASYGYVYAENGDTTFWFMLIGSIIAGAWITYSKDEE